MKDMKSSDIPKENAPGTRVTRKDFLCSGAVATVMAVITSMPIWRYLDLCDAREGLPEKYALLTSQLQQRGNQPIGQDLRNEIAEYNRQAEEYNRMLFSFEHDGRMGTLPLITLE